MRTTQSVVLGWIHDAVAPSGWLITDLESETTGYLRMVLTPSVGAPTDVYEASSRTQARRTPIRSVKFGFTPYSFNFRVWERFDPAPARWVPLTRFVHEGAPTTTHEPSDATTIEGAIDVIVGYLVEGRL